MQLGRSSPNGVAKTFRRAGAARVPQVQGSRTFAHVVLRNPSFILHTDPLPLPVSSISTSGKGADKS